MKNRILSILLLLIPIVNLFAQVPPPPDYAEDAGGPGSGETPIDQYLVILVLAIIFVSAYYFWNQRKLAKN